MRPWAAGLVVSFGSSCALLYDFGDGAGGQGTGPGATVSTSTGSIDPIASANSAISAATASGAGGASATLEVEACALLGGDDSDLPGEPAFALTPGGLYYTGTYTNQPVYFGMPMEKVDVSDGRGVALAVLDPTTFAPLFVKKGRIVSPTRRAFVVSSGDGALFGGTFVDGGSFLFAGTDSETANDRDGFLVKYGPFADADGPTRSWDVTPSDFIGGSGAQQVTAAFDMIVESQQTLFVAGGTKAMGMAGACAEIPNSPVLKGFVRAVFVPTPTCAFTTPYADAVQSQAVHDMVVTDETQDPRPFHVALQVGDGKTPGYGRVLRYDRTEQEVFDGRGAGADTLGNVRLARARTGAVLCATRYACDVTPCDEPDHRVPMAFVSGTVEDEASYDQVLTATPASVGAFVECNAIAYHDGEVLVGGRFSGAIALSTPTGAAADLSSLRGDVQAFVARYAADGSHVSVSTFGGPGAQDITTILDGGDGDVLIAGATEGALAGQTCSGAFAGGTDVFLLRARLGH